MLLTRPTPQTKRTRLYSEEALAARAQAARDGYVSMTTGYCRSEEEMMRRVTADLDAAGHPWRLVPATPGRREVWRKSAARMAAEARQAARGERGDAS